jgi:hypothetical protein
MGTHSVSKLKEPFLPRPGQAAFSDILRAGGPAVANPSSQSLRCIRGIRFALLIEIVAGLCAYEIWRLL